MKILAIETATTVCAAAVVNGDTILADATLDEKYIHAEKLMTQIDRVLTESGCPLAGLDAIAVSIGPGSFTGLRIGLSVAKGLAYAAEKPLVPVPTLQGLAQRAVQEGFTTEGDRILAALDARRGEVYCQLFEQRGARTHAVGPVQDVRLEEVAGALPAGRTWITGDTAARVKSALDAGGKEPPPHVMVVPAESARCSAGTVGLVGHDLLSSGQTADPRRLEPMYIKEFFIRTKT